MRPEEQDRLNRLKQLDEREAHLRKFALTLLQQCKDEKLTMKELDSVVSTIQHFAKKTTLHAGLELWGRR